jgi:hypothetical protein
MSGLRPPILALVTEKIETEIYGRLPLFLEGVVTGNILLVVKAKQFRSWTSYSCVV